MARIVTVVCFIAFISWTNYLEIAPTKKHYSHPGKNGRRVPRDEKQLFLINLVHSGRRAPRAEQITICLILHYVNWF